MNAHWLWLLYPVVGVVVGLLVNKEFERTELSELILVSFIWPCLIMFVIILGIVDVLENIVRVKVKNPFYRKKQGK